MKNTTWLQNLKAGDEVIVEERFINKVERVQKATETQIVLPGNFRYYKETGIEVSCDRWNRGALRECTPEARAKIVADNRHRWICAALSGVIWKQVPLEKLENIYALLAPLPEKPK